MPRTIVDLVSARPIDLAIVEGIKTMTGGEGLSRVFTWVDPGLLMSHGITATECLAADT